MYYKILKGTDLFKKLDEVNDRRVAANQAAIDFTLKYNSDGKHLGLGDARVLGGGITGIYFESQPDGWIRPIKDHKDYYRPKKNKTNAELIAEWEALPIVERDDVNTLINYETGSFGRHWYFGCAITLGREDFITVKIQPERTDYKPVPDMIEILASEYNELESKEK